MSITIAGLPATVAEYCFSGSSIVVGQDQKQSIDELVERMLEAAPEFKEINSKYLDAVIKYAT